MSTVLVVLAKQLRCEYPRSGDTCDDHRRKGTKDFERCLQCRIRDIAERIKP